MVAQTRAEIVAVSKARLLMVNALDDLPKLEEAMLKRSNRRFELQVCRVSEDNETDNVCYLQVDLETGDLILAAAKEIIRKRAQELGVPL
jgi:hypothetical protein